MDPMRDLSSTEFVHVLPSGRRVLVTAHPQDGVAYDMDDETWTHEALEELVRERAAVLAHAEQSLALAAAIERMGSAEFTD